LVIKKYDSSSHKSVLSLLQTKLYHLSDLSLSWGRYVCSGCSSK